MARLDRAAVIAGAWDFVEAHGLDALTMRKLASSLGVNHGTLYWHVENKRALVDALAEDLLAGVADVDPAHQGADRLIALAGRLRSALLSHRDGARVMAGTFVRQPNTLAFGEAAIAAARAAGAQSADAALAAFSVQYFVLGFTIEEQAHQQLTAADAQPTDTADTTDFDADRFPLVASALDTMREIPRDAQFDYGVRQLVRSLRFTERRGRSD
ncbi:TetR/AcrR family transcriptional regulator C-terminal domain-containing protein [Kitasatospora sp. NPDC052896]|uniref:TetR/AcrR family transcriptional regulator C-terminal domain-containing protein n=1 Tax=Kitasatospora sp. NPDC052896 TaxID=3364061 RepID=UPI0037CA75B8